MIQGYKMKTNDPRNFGGSFVGCGGENRIFQETGIGTTNYLHDNANRLTSANRVSYT